MTNPYPDNGPALRNCKTDEARVYLRQALGDRGLWELEQQFRVDDERIAAREAAPFRKVVPSEPESQHQNVFP